MIRKDLYSLLRWSRSRLVLLVLVVCTAGCGSMPKEGGLEQRTFLNVDRKTWSQSAYDAFFNFRTLVPLSAAIIFSLGDLDEDVSDWARDDTPIFGSEQNAQDVSDILRAALAVETLALIAATPSGIDPEQGRPRSKWRDLGMTVVAVGLETGTSQAGKALTSRTRPNEEDDRSFPSAHASNSAVTSTLSNRQLEKIELAPWAKKSIRVSNVVIASATAWARVEGGVHFPSDVLAGSALGSFFGNFIYDAFNSTPGPQRFQLSVGPSKEGAMARITIPLR